MDYRKFGQTFYVRVDKGEEIVSSILSICQRESVPSACFSGIGGCSKAELQVFNPDKGEFKTTAVEGMLELVSLNGNVFYAGEGAGSADGDAGESGGEDASEGVQLKHHTHANFCYEDESGHHVISGHLKSAVVLYTAEIELRPVEGGLIRAKFDPETGTAFWDFD